MSKKSREQAIETRYETQVNCRGCRKPIDVQFEDVPLEITSLLMTCPHCKSQIEVEAKSCGFQKIMTRVSMVKHSQKLLDILAERDYAED